MAKKNVIFDTQQTELALTYKIQHNVCSSKLKRTILNIYSYALLKSKHFLKKVCLKFEKN